jgi:hypothetical protein
VTSVKKKNSWDDIELVKRTVEQAYRAHDDALANKDYYDTVLRNVRAWNRAYEITLAVCGSGAVAAWTIWRSGAGHTAWVVIAALVTVLAITKPFLQLASYIERYSERHTSWLVLWSQFDYLADEIDRNRKFDEELMRALQNAMLKRKDLREKNGQMARKKLFERINARVNSAVAGQNRWLPSEPLTSLR